MPGEKRQAGAVLCLTNAPREVVDGRFDRQVPLAWTSSRVKRVVRSTLVAEAYSISEAMEHGQFLRQFLQELYKPANAKLKDVERLRASRPILAVTDSDNLKGTLNKDSGSVADIRLRIVVSMLRESVEAQENTALIWTRTEAMVADGLTKSLVDIAILIAFFVSKKFEISPPQRKRRAAKPTTADFIDKTIDHEGIGHHAEEINREWIGHHVRRINREWIGHHVRRINRE
ncbi:unnamed protein product [Prorocentrum cordatum]|uniref:Uncharacterized protein n=1 Tax=Prorocentrum cordatum TaxID=2364126 RepID=A0ABN9SIG2_9DINO|nr:unnamed protein product [Polarella glacialis]